MSDSLHIKSQSDGHSMVLRTTYGMFDEKGQLKKDAVKKPATTIDDDAKESVDDYDIFIE